MPCADTRDADLHIDTMAIITTTALVLGGLLFSQEPQDPPAPTPRVDHLLGDLVSRQVAHETFDAAGAEAAAVRAAPPELHQGDRQVAGELMPVGLHART